MKKIIALLIALICLSVTFAGCGSSDNKEKPGNSENSNNGIEQAPATSPIEDFEFEADENGLTVTKYLGSAKKIVIPSIVDNKKVVDLSPEVFGGNVIVEEIVLSYYMTALYLDCFKGCDNLNTLTCSGFVEYDSYYVLDANYYPKSLTTLIFPSLKSIDAKTLNDIKSTSYVNTFICNAATEIEDVDFNRSSRRGNYSLVIPDALLNHLKSRKAYYYSYEKISKSNFNEEIIESSSAWSLVVPFESAFVEDGMYTLVDKSYYLDSFISLTESILISEMEDESSIVEVNYGAEIVLECTYKRKNGILCYLFFTFGDNDNDYELIRYDGIEESNDPNIVFTTAFGRVDSITVNGTTYSYDHE